MLSDPQLHYLDNAATSRVDPAVAQAITTAMVEHWANPSSLYDPAVAAQDAIMTARARVAKTLHCRSDEIYFTACGSEGNNMAVYGAARPRKHWGNKIVVTGFEHPSVQRPIRALKDEGFTVVEVLPGPDGRIDTQKFLAEIDKSTVLAACMAVNNETGAVQDVAIVNGKKGMITAEVQLSEKAIANAEKSGEAVKLPVEVKAGKNIKAASTVTINLPEGAGKTKVKIPVKNMTVGTVAVLVNADGTEKIVKKSVAAKDGVQLIVDEDTTVKLVDKAKNFKDTKKHWAKDSIDFVSARGLMNGKSSTAFAPEAKITRARLWTILARWEDVDLTGGKKWYSKARAWAKNQGISDGSRPNAAITRAEAITMLWRAQGKPAAEQETAFKDVSSDEYYAQAVAWAKEKGIAQANSKGRFNPDAACTRAEIAAFLYRMSLSE